ncbi:choice-of-anchor Q domain-containing protein [Spirosoma validum]|uniref:Immunoglobulin domain-containing protein n=1 Tax=Spirosoma validum TaxID=2771355 RepID=A0A927B1R4_9BACT|nr:choice-of-anchor Q domain-containing protein [Spirosoma validum]MBD2753981.1 immunoglobulin domain-containing protein [Spirosoma validum]
MGNTGNGGAMVNLNGQPQLISCVLFNNGGSNSLINANNSSVTARYSLFEASITDYSGTNNLTTTSSPFASTGSAVLNSCSPAINAGDPASTTATNGTTDVAGNGRFYNNSRIDMGAFEYQGAQSLPATITAQPRSGSTVPLGSTVTVAVSITGTVSSYQWYKNGNVVSGQTSATLALNNVQAGDAGNYVVVIVSPCNSVTSTPFSLSVTAVPDLTPILYARPTTLTGDSPLSVVADVVELNGVTITGTITLKITRDAKVSLSLPSSATSVANRSVQNSLWQLNTSDANYYVLTTTQPIAGGDKLSVGLTGTLTPGATVGMLTVSGVLVNIPSEIRSSNNVDSDKIEYFQQ